MNIKPNELKENIFELIGDRWMLITAGKGNEINTMTASFGGFGVLFFKNVAHIYVRPERHTFGYLESNDTFSLCFFDDSYKKELTYCGRTSGRDEDKINKCGFTVLTDNDTPYFKQSKITVICKKIYSQDIAKECFTDIEAYEKTYSSGGMHRMYIGEILNVITE